MPICSATSWASLSSRKGGKATFAMTASARSFRVSRRGRQQGAVDAPGKGDDHFAKLGLGSLSSRGELCVET